GIGGKIRAAGAGSEDDHAVFFQVADGAAPDEGLGHLVHFNGAHDAGENFLLLQRVLQGQRVDYGGQHAHMIGGDAVHILRLFGDSAEEVSATDHNSDFHAQAVDFPD